MNYVSHLNLFGIDAKQIPTITGEGAPTTATEGAAGCLYMDTKTGDLYKCTAVTNGVYTWVSVIPDSSQNADLSGYVKSVNGEPPDANGNVVIETNAPTDEQVATAVNNYLTEHPEATTTVEDGSITEEKLNDSVKRRIRRPNCKIIAHRGYWATAHQNTVASFIEAVNDGFDWLEIDIRITADGIYVLAHDAGFTLYDADGAAVTGTWGSVNYADVKDCTWDAAGVYKLNTLQSAFAAMKVHDVTIICDRKTGTNEGILTLAALCGVSDKIMLSYASPTAALNEKTLLNRYKQIPIRVGVSTYNDMLTLMDGVVNPIYADINASTTASYQQKAQIALACHLPMIYAGCTMDRTERWAVLANGVMASTNVSHANLCAAIDIDYDAVATITAEDSVTVAVAGTYTLEASSDLDTAAGYVYGYSVNPNIATVKQTVFGSTATLVITGVAAGTTTIRLFTGCGAIKDIVCTVGASGGDSGDSGETETTTYSITNNLTNVSTSNSVASVAQNSAYTANLTAHSGYEINAVTVTMGGADITATAYSGGVVTIASVTGNVVITATATAASGFEPVVVDVSYLYNLRCTKDFTVGNYANRALIYQENGSLAFTNSVINETSAGYGMVFYPIAIPEGATKITIVCGGLKWGGFFYDSTGANILNTNGGNMSDQESGATYEFATAHSGAAYVGATLKDGTSETIEADTDTSGFTVTFS